MRCKDGSIREILEVRKDTRPDHWGEYIVVYNLTETKRASLGVEASDELAAYKQFVEMYQTNEGEPNNVS